MKYILSIQQIFKGMKIIVNKPYKSVLSNRKITNS